VFYADADTRNQPVKKQIREPQLLAFRFLAGLESENAPGLISLEARIFVQCGMRRILNRFRVRDFLVMRFATVGLAEIVDALGVFVAQDHVLVGVRLFFHYTFHAVFQGFSGAAAAARFRR
jgi:hypothetical protein